MSLNFGSDYRGSEVANVTLHGKYRIELSCSGDESVRIAVVVGTHVLEETSIPCAAASSAEFEVDPPTSGEVQLDLTSSTAEGTARLIAIE